MDKKGPPVFPGALSSCGEKRRTGSRIRYYFFFFFAEPGGSMTALAFSTTAAGVA